MSDSADSPVTTGMRLPATYEQHHHWHDLDEMLPLLALGAVVFFITTLAVYLYAVTQ
jgi:hypothetical protein